MIKVTTFDKVNLSENEIFVPVLENKIDTNVLFDKIEQNEAKIILERAIKFGFIGEKNQYFSYKNYHFFGIGKEIDITNDSYLRVAKNIFKKAIKEKHLDTYFVVEESRVPQIAEAFYFAKYSFSKYKTDKKDKKELNLYLILPSEADKQVNNQLLQIECVANGVDLSRDLINEPSSNMHADVLLEKAKKIVADSEGYLEIEVLDRKKCQELGMNAYLSVAQGSHKEPIFIIIKTQNKDNKKPLVLIGKSVTFDSGGLSLKPGESMEDMKIDMAGGAIVLGAMNALSNLHKNNLGIAKNIIGILPCCENMLSSQAIRPGDIVTALNGKTIEILNTDAEGRLTLADALSYAQKYLNPEIVIDIATLTGAIMSALGPSIAGLFSNNDKLAKDLIDAGALSGEAIWQMPLYAPYTKHVKSDIADLRNTSKIRLAGSITASLFLKNFITDKIRWVHLDVAGVVMDKLATGWGVKTVINLLNK